MAHSQKEVTEFIRENPGQESSESPLYYKLFINKINFYNANCETNCVASEKIK